MIGRVVLGRYRIVRLIARGGMGSIYLARNKGAAGFVRPAVVKKILPSYLGDDSAVSMFAREARIMSNLRHPGIVSVIDFAEEEGAYVMVLEYVHGSHTGRWLRFLRKTRRHFPVDLGLQIITLVLDALDYAHTATSLDGTPLQIVHRDIKPSNILVDVAGHVKLADFGIARAPNDHTELSSGTTKLKGTFPYLAPEIFDNVEPSTHTDVYACGVVLHTLLSGRNEFAAKEVSTTIMRVLEHIPTPLDRVRTDVSPEVAAVVARCLAKDPLERYQTAADLATALRSVRQVDEAQANEFLRTEAAKDFRDQRFAQLLTIDDLATLERSLTTEQEEEIEGITESGLVNAVRPKGSDTEPSIGFGLRSADDGSATVPSVERAVLDDVRGKRKSEADFEPTRAARPQQREESLNSTDAVPAVGRSSWPMVFGVIVGAAIIAGAIVFAFKRQETRAAGPPPVTYLDASAGPMDSFDAAVPYSIDASIAEAAPAETGDNGDSSRVRGCAAKKTPSDKIQCSVAKRRGAMSRCEKLADTGTIGNITMGVRIAANGSATVSFVPGRVAQTKLGQCLIKVMRQKYPEIGQPLSFNIPIQSSAVEK